MLYEEILEIAPSIIIFHQANDYDQKTYPELKKLATEIIGKASLDTAFGEAPEVRLTEFSENGDNIIAASLLHSSLDLSYEQCKTIVKSLSQEEKKRIFKTAWQNMQFYDSLPREFEYVNLTFNIVLSSACFGQLKRHRMATLTAQVYDPNLGITIPESVKQSGMEAFFRGIVDKTNDVYKVINKEMPLAAPYILTNAHRKRVLIRVNARELYHISRLREDTHAQWDIQNISRAMSARAQKVMPLTFALIGGKDKYNEVYQDVYSKLPKVIEAVLPGARKINKKENS